MEYVRVDLMLFQQNLNTACVQGLLWLSLQPPKWEPSPSPRCWIRREWKNPSSQVSSYLLRQKTCSRISAPHLRSMTIICMLMCKIFQDLEPLPAPSADNIKGTGEAAPSAQRFHRARLQMARDCHRGEQDCKHFYHHRTEKEEVFLHYLAKVLLELQIKAALSRCLRAYRDLHRNGVFTILSVVPST